MGHYDVYRILRGRKKIICVKLKNGELKMKKIKQLISRDKRIIKNWNLKLKPFLYGLVLKNNDSIIMTHPLFYCWSILYRSN